jgi:hypothetical protein
VSSDELIEVVNRSTHVGLVPEGLMRGQRPKEWPSGRSVFLLRRRGKTRIPLQKLSSCVAGAKLELLSAVTVAMEFWSLPGSSGGVAHG